MHCIPTHPLNAMSLRASSLNPSLSRVVPPIIPSVVWCSPSVVFRLLLPPFFRHAIYDFVKVDSGVCGSGGGLGDDGGGLGDDGGGHVLRGEMTLKKRII